MQNLAQIELGMYMPESRNFSEMLSFSKMLSQKSCVLQFLEAALQDFSLLGAQQLGLETRAFDSYPLTDQEVCLRDFQQKTQSAVADRQSEQRRN